MLLRLVCVAVQAGLLPLGFACALATPPVSAGDGNGRGLHVAPSGDNAGDGSTTRPFATLERARDEVRAIRKARPLPAGGVTITLHAGVYELARTLALTQEDAGTAASPIVYRAAPGAEVRISGGKRIAGWRAVNDPAVLDRLDPAARGHVVQADLKTLGITDFGTIGGGFGLVGYLNNSIKVKELFHRDKDYIVRNGEVVIVDEFTGRVLDGRRFNEGLHQAIEAKEGVEVQAENQTLATITLQNYFRMYDKLAGMTGTADTEAAEFDQIYKLGVLPIPTNKPMIRKDQTDLIYKTEEAKFDAVVDDIAERHEKGQPVLIGTTSVERSEYLSRQLQRRKIPHNVLNAKFHEQEAQIIAEAGQVGAVTVATNMAGRGTDVVLGGNADIIADSRLRKAGLDPVHTPEEYEAAWDEAITLARENAEREADRVRAAGGLYVLGTERHESRRIDNQLRGRSGRQGDPGESRFYLSLGDELMRRFNGAALEAIMNRVNLPDDVPIEAKMVTKAIRSAQTQVEQQNFEVRKNVLKYDEVMNEQRKVIYRERSTILAGEDHREQVQQFIDDVVGAYVDGATGEGYAEDWDVDELWAALRTLYPVELSPRQVLGENEFGERDDVAAEDLREILVADAHNAYAKREDDIDAMAGEGAMRQLERSILLSVIDRKWRDHLYEMDYLREGIYLRSLAQADPVVEYQREGFDMFHGMLEGIKEEALGFLFNAQVETEPAYQQEPELPTGPVADSADESKVPAGLRARGVPAVPTEVPMVFTGPDESGDTAAFDEEAGEPSAETAASSAGRRSNRRAKRGKPASSKAKRRR